MKNKKLREENVAEFSQYFVWLFMSPILSPFKVIKKGFIGKFILMQFDVLTLLVPCISESCIEKGFMKDLKAFINPSEAPQRSVRIEI